MAWTTDPGAVPMGARPLIKVKRAGENVKNDDEDGSNDNKETGGGNGGGDDDENDKLAAAKQDGSNTDKKKKKKKKKKERAIRRCAKCNDNFKPPRAHHDSVTGRCVVKMDHFWCVLLCVFACLLSSIPSNDGLALRT